MPPLTEDLLWDVRAFVYHQFAVTTRPPSVEEAAAHFRLGPEEAAGAYDELHRRHALFLEPGTSRIRMANPFSAVTTAFQVRAQSQAYWANCAWDALGVPAALRCDAIVHTECAESHRPITLTLENGRVTDQGERVHFLVPFRRWYEDLVFT